MGIGIAIRDGEGKVLACLSSLKSFNSQPIIAECWAIWRTIKFCVEPSLKNIKLEGDAQMIIIAIQQEETNWSWYG